ncbi:MAG: hypothetical protein ACI9EW_003373 [Cellvibrionaceae bacterium]|jgi:hypothetical protein
MARKKAVVLDNTQQKKNETILQRLAAERQALISDTLAIQEEWNSRKRRRRRRGEF